MVFDALALAKQYYTKEQLEHGQRVTTIAKNLYFWYQGELDECYSLINCALLHDLFEDTECPMDEIPDRTVRDAVTILTRRAAETYIDYINRIVISSSDSDAGRLAWKVKVADILDHLNQKKTLPDTLKNRYDRALNYLLRVPASMTVFPSVANDQKLFAKWVVNEYGALSCSSCHKLPLLDGSEDYALSRFCPHCGRRMSNGVHIQDNF